jgi:alpha-D-xyloside xylohydrolase
VSADFSADRARVPLYIREGAIVPMSVEDDVLGLGDAASKGALTVLVAPSVAGSSFRLREEDDAVTTIEAKATSSGAEVKLSQVKKRTLLRIRSEKAPASATVDGAAVTPRYDAAKKTAIVEVAPKDGAVSVVLTAP